MSTGSLGAVASPPPEARYSPLVPTGEKTQRTAGRCSLHPGRASVGSCDGCGRLLCLSCAVPVRGVLVGAECLAAVLGPDVPETVPGRTPHPGGGAFLMTGLGMAGAFVATALPWTNAVTSSHVRGTFGSWEISPASWALLSAVAATVGLALWVAGRLRPALMRTLVLAVIGALGTLVAVGAVMFLVNPPFATHPWLGPWVAIGAAAVALAGCLLTGRRVRSRRAR